jgi:hypothetical protein
MGSKMEKDGRKAFMFVRTRPRDHLCYSDYVQKCQVAIRSPSPYISVIILMAEKKTHEMPVNIG